MVGEDKYSNNISGGTDTNKYIIYCILYILILKTGGDGHMTFKIGTDTHTHAPLWLFNRDCLRYLLTIIYFIIRESKRKDNYANIIFLI